MIFSVFVEIFLNNFLLKVIVHFSVDCILIFCKTRIFFVILPNTVPTEGVSQRMEQPNVPNDIVPKQSKFHLYFHYFNFIALSKIFL